MSYDPTLPASNLNKVRLLIGDTSNDVALERFTDADITLLLDMESATGEAKPFFVAATALSSDQGKFMFTGKGVLEQDTGLYNRTKFGMARDSAEAIAAQILLYQKKGSELLMGGHRDGLTVIFG